MELKTNLKNHKVIAKLINKGTIYFFIDLYFNHIFITLIIVNIFKKQKITI